MEGQSYKDFRDLSGLLSTVLYKLLLVLLPKKPHALCRFTPLLEIAESGVHKTHYVEFYQVQFMKNFCTSWMKVNKIY